MWDKVGDFSKQDYGQYYGSRTDVNRELSYSTNDPSLLAAISFIGFNTGGLGVKLVFNCFSEENTADVRTITALMATLPGVELNASGQIRFSVNASDSFSRLLTILSDKSPTFSDISEDIRLLVAPTLTVAYSPSQHRFYPSGGTEEQMAYSYNPDRSSFLLQRLMKEEETAQHQDDKVELGANNYF